MDRRYPDDQAGVSIVSPLTYALYQNYPNPFNPATEILFEIAESEHVVLSVFNIAGQEVATLVNEARAGGLHRARFDGSGLPSGIYFYTLTANQFTATKKMLLMK
ncbi:MAG: T9SS type A sorting domain-containing protein [bacterium]|nr:T9SS type A sorting domain-containing protein [bacterium]